MGLLAAEIIAKTGRDPSQLFSALTAELGVPFYERIDVAGDVKAEELRSRRSGLNSST